MLQFVRKDGTIVRLRPHRKQSLRKVYTISDDYFVENIKAVNHFMAYMKFCIKHPLCLFKIDTKGVM